MRTGTHSKCGRESIPGARGQCKALPSGGQCGCSAVSVGWQVFRWSVTGPGDVGKNFGFYIESEGKPLKIGTRERESWSNLPS